MTPVFFFLLGMDAGGPVAEDAPSPYLPGRVQQECSYSARPQGTDSYLARVQEDCTRLGRAQEKL